MRLHLLNWKSLHNWCQAFFLISVPRSAVLDQALRIVSIMRKTLVTLGGTQGVRWVLIELVLAVVEEEEQLRIWHRYQRNRVVCPPLVSLTLSPTSLWTASRFPCRPSPRTHSTALKMNSPPAYQLLEEWWSNLTPNMILSPCHWVSRARTESQSQPIYHLQLVSWASLANAMTRRAREQEILQKCLTQSSHLLTNRPLRSTLASRQLVSQNNLLLRDSQTCSEEKARTQSDHLQSLLHEPVLTKQILIPPKARPGEASVDQLLLTSAQHRPTWTSLLSMVPKVLAECPTYLRPVLHTAHSPSDARAAWVLGTCTELKRSSRSWESGLEIIQRWAYIVNALGIYTHKKFILSTSTALFRLSFSLFFFLCLAFFVPLFQDFEEDEELTQKLKGFLKDLILQDAPEARLAEDTLR